MQRAATRGRAAASLAVLAAVLVLLALPHLAVAQNAVAFADLFGEWAVVENTVGAQIDGEDCPVTRPLNILLNFTEVNPEDAQEWTAEIKYISSWEEGQFEGVDTFLGEAVGSGLSQCRFNYDAATATTSITNCFAGEQTLDGVLLRLSASKDTLELAYAQSTQVLAFASSVNTVATASAVRINTLNTIRAGAAAPGADQPVNVSGLWFGAPRRPQVDWDTDYEQTPDCVGASWFWRITLHADGTGGTVLGLMRYTVPTESDTSTAPVLQLGARSMYDGEFQWSTAVGAQTTDNGARIASFSLNRLATLSDAGDGTFTWTPRYLVGSLRILELGYPQRLDLILSTTLTASPTTALAPEVAAELNLAQTQLTTNQDRDDPAGGPYVSASLSRLVVSPQTGVVVDTELVGQWRGAVLPSLASEATCGVRSETQLGTDRVAVASESATVQFFLNGTFAITDGPYALTSSQTATWTVLAPGYGYVAVQTSETSLVYYPITYRLTDVNNTRLDLLISRQPQDQEQTTLSDEALSSFAAWFDRNDQSVRMSLGLAVSPPSGPATAPGAAPSFVARPRAVTNASALTEALASLDGTWMGVFTGADDAAANCTAALRLYVDWAAPGTMRVATAFGASGRAAFLPDTAVAAEWPLLESDSFAVTSSSGGSDSAPTTGEFALAFSGLTDRGAVGGRFERQANGTLLFTLNTLGNTTAPAFGQYQTQADVIESLLYYAPTDEPATFPTPGQPTLRLTPLLTSGARSPTAGSIDLSFVSLRTTLTRIDVPLGSTTWSNATSQPNPVVSRTVFSNTIANNNATLDVTFDSYLSPLNVEPTSSPGVSLAVPGGTIKITFSIRGADPAFTEPLTICQQLSAPNSRKFERFETGRVAGPPELYLARYDLGDLTYLTVRALLQALADGVAGPVKPSASTGGLLCYDLPLFASDLEYDPDIGVLVANNNQRARRGDDSGSDDVLPQGAIIGIAVGGAALLLLLCAICVVIVVAVVGGIFLTVRRRRRVRAVSRKIRAAQDF